MLTFLLTLVALLAVVGAMSIGVIMGRKPIAGSCGGVGAALGEKDYVCDFCGGDPNKCEQTSTSPSSTQSSSTQSNNKALGYDASR